MKTLPSWCKEPVAGEVRKHWQDPCVWNVNSSPEKYWSQLETFNKDLLEPPLYNAAQFWQVTQQVLTRSEHRWGDTSYTFLFLFKKKDKVWNFQSKFWLVEIKQFLFIYCYNGDFSDCGRCLGVQSAVYNTERSGPTHRRGRGPLTNCADLILYRRAAPDVQ